MARSHTILPLCAGKREVRRVNLPSGPDDAEIGHDLGSDTSRRLP